LMEIGNVYFGFRFPQPCVSVSPQELLEYMFRTGTFGTATDADRTAGRIVDDTVQAETSSGRKYATYLRLLFPSWKTWTFWKPYLSDRPWMLPVEWCKRMVRFLRGETSSGSLDEIEKSYVLAENRLTLLKKYGVL
ncbi:MAG: hypothetical protein LUE21_02095, partial [Oscillospiraceae bacterium]|nr:hypothetical protein [Oscillospiraceae bacterium]